MGWKGISGNSGRFVTQLFMVESFSIAVHLAYDVSTVCWVVRLAPNPVNPVHPV